MLVTVATKQKVVMIEAGANEVEESVMLEGSNSLTSTLSNFAIFYKRYSS